MKNSLLAGLLKNTALNANQDLERVALFEIGNAFGQGEGRIREEKKLAVSAYGLQQKKDWRCREAAFDFSYFKSLLAMLGRRLRLEFAFKKHAHPAYADSCCFAIEIDGRRCGLCGEVNRSSAAITSWTNRFSRRKSTCRSCSGKCRKIVFKCGSAFRPSGAILPS